MTNKLRHHAPHHCVNRTGRNRMLRKNYAGEITPAAPMEIMEEENFSFLHGRRGRMGRMVVDSSRISFFVVVPLVWQFIKSEYLLLTTAANPYYICVRAPRYWGRPRVRVCRSWRQNAQKWRPKTLLCGVQNADFVVRVGGVMLYQWSGQVVAEVCAWKSPLK